MNIEWGSVVYNRKETEYVALSKNKNKIYHMLSNGSWFGFYVAKSNIFWDELLYDGTNFVAISIPSKCFAYSRNGFMWKVIQIPTEISRWTYFYISVLCGFSDYSIVTRMFVMDYYIEIKNNKECII